QKKFESSRTRPNRVASCAMFGIVFYTEVDCVACLMDQGVRPVGSPGRPRRNRDGAGPGLDRLPALALRAAPSPRQRVPVPLALRPVLLLPPRAADRPSDPRPLLPQLLRRIPGPGLPPPAWLARLEQEEILPGISLLPRRLLSPCRSDSDVR